MGAEKLLGSGFVVKNRIDEVQHGLPRFWRLQDFDGLPRRLDEACLFRSSVSCKFGPARL